MAKRYYWIKMQEDWLDGINERRLRRMTGGDRLLIVYLKLILKTIRTGGIYEIANGDNLISELAILTDERPEDISGVLGVLGKYGAAEIYENGIKIDYVVERIGSEGESAERTRKWRAKIKSEKNITEIQDASHCDKDVTSRDARCDTEQQQEEEQEKEQQQQYGVVDEQDIFNRLTAVPWTITAGRAKKLIIKYSATRCAAWELWARKKRRKGEDIGAGLLITMISDTNEPTPAAELAELHKLKQMHIATVEAAKATKMDMEMAAAEAITEPYLAEALLRHSKGDRM